MTGAPLASQHGLPARPRREHRFPRGVRPRLGCSIGRQTMRAESDYLCAGATLQIAGTATSVFGDKRVSSFSERAFDRHTPLQVRLIYTTPIVRTESPDMGAISAVFMAVDLSGRDRRSPGSGTDDVTHDLVRQRRRGSEPDRSLGQLEGRELVAHRVHDPGTEREDAQMLPGSPESEQGEGGGGREGGGGGGGGGKRGEGGGGGGRGEGGGGGGGEGGGGEERGARAGFASAASAAIP